MTKLKGKILIIGPSRAGKSYFCHAFKKMGLPAVDLDGDTDLVQWYNDATRKVIKQPPIPKTREWFATHHFLIKRSDLHKMLAKQNDIIVFGHCWNIMDVLDEFDHVAFMYLSDEELNKRFLNKRADHTTNVPTEAEMAFFRDRHHHRQSQAKELGLPFLDATQTPQAFYNQLLRML